jgi:hypothetical protein
VTHTVAAPAPAKAAPVAPPTTIASPPTTAAAPTSTSTSLVAAAPTWPTATLNSERAASHSGEGPNLSTVAVVAAVLLMLVAGVEAHTLRRRAERS